MIDEGTVVHAEFPSYHVSRETEMDYSTHRKCMILFAACRYFFDRKK